jgi:alkylation response protein AidB-like acyl-CoA dehydrogenase
MFIPTTERQARFIALAGELADRFATRAAEQDRSGAFPFANFDDIRAAGLPALVVPEALGGWGASLLETVMTMERLAQGDGSTALSLAMHMQTLGSAAEAGNWPQAIFAALPRTP